MKLWIAAALLCRALDAGTSLAAFHAGAREVIPWMPVRPAYVLVVHVGIGTTQTAALLSLTHTHPTRAKVLAAITAGTECAVGGWNLHTLHTMREEPQARSAKETP